MTAPRPRATVMTVAPYVGGEFKLPGINRVIKLSSNEGAFGPPPGAVAAAQRAAAESHRYPDADSRALRQAIGARYGLDPARVVCGNGSDELLGLLINAYAEPGSELIMSQYGFIMYGIAGMMAGARVIKVPEREFTTDVDALIAAVTPATRIVIMANPNNPTGSVLPRGEMERLQAGLPPEVLLVIDAAYAEYVENPDYEPGIALVDASENTVMSRTFSKVYGMGGLRLGWIYAPPAIVDVLNRVRPPFNVTLPAQEAGIAALAEPDWVQTSFTHNLAERARLSEGLTGLGIRVWPTECNFVLADFGTKEAASAADAALRRRGIIVRAMASYALPHCLRITVGTAEENSMVIDALADWRG